MTYALAALASWRLVNPLYSLLLQRAEGPDFAYAVPRIFDVGLAAYRFVAFKEARRK